MTSVRERLPDWRACGQGHRIPSASERAREIRVMASQHR